VALCAIFEFAVTAFAQQSFHLSAIADYSPKQDGAWVIFRDANMLTVVPA
jgi:hypothetical protein